MAGEVATPNEIYAQVQREVSAQYGTPAKADLARVLTAIALAESGGQLDARGRNTNGTTDRGLFQFNNGPNTAGTGFPDSGADNFAESSKRAVTVARSDGSGLRNWTTYTNLAYVAFMPLAGTPAGDKQVKAGPTTGDVGAAVPLGADLGIIDGALGAFSDLKAAALALVNKLFDIGTWVRVLEVLGGGAAVAMGLYLVAQDLGINVPMPIPV